MPALPGAWSFFPIFGADFVVRVQGAAKDSAFFGVRLADGLKFDTTSLGLRTKVSSNLCMCVHSA